MKEKIKKNIGFGSFPNLFWLVVMFEFFERGSYYGMMSFISVYFVDVLHFPKENVGIIKSVIQPLLYFLPIISGALADRFGYRRLLMVAFSLLGGGYFLTSQATSYGTVFAALVIMGFGAGIFKPLITGVIAKVTDRKNSTLGFGIYYWSINIGAFLFPLFLVPFLKAMNPTYVIIASAICTASMLIPTILFFKDPAKMERIKKREQTNLVQTIANGFEIIYSPIVLLYYQMKKSISRKLIWCVILMALLGYSLFQYINKKPTLDKFSRFGIAGKNSTLIFNVNRNMLGKDNYKIERGKDDSTRFDLTIFKPEYLDQFSSEILTRIKSIPGFEKTSESDLRKWINFSDKKLIVRFSQSSLIKTDFGIEKLDDAHYGVILKSGTNFDEYKQRLLTTLHHIPILSGLTMKDCERLYQSTTARSFFNLFVVALIAIALGIVSFSTAGERKEGKASTNLIIPFLITLAIGASLWLIPGLNILGRIIASVIYLTASSLFIIDKSDPGKFISHAKFLLMIVLYSGFWVLYFQMFDSVLWYVKAYVDASSLNHTINKFLGLFGINANWFFDVEHVTVINAGTIILLQILISTIVKNRKPLPTMMFGIGLGTLGMAILAINTNIWIFLAGIAIFSIGEMTAHPKFYSYIGLVAPKDKKAMYMGYVFLYGVFGSSVAGIVGAKLYVHFVDGLNQPRTLWLIFSSIGLFTIAALALYNKFIKSDSK